MIDLQGEQVAVPRHPLGPVWLRTPISQSRPTRARCLVEAVLCSALVTVAASLTPAPEGYDTHAQLGLPSCGWPATVGIPCPACGMTTAFAWTVRGRVITGFVVQPVGAMIAWATMLYLLHAVVGMVTGRAWRLNWYRVRLSVVMVTLAGCVLAAWAYKILVMG